MNIQTERNVMLNETRLETLTLALALDIGLRILDLWILGSVHPGYVICTRLMCPACMGLPYGSIISYRQNSKKYGDFRKMKNSIFGRFQAVVYLYYAQDCVQD